MATCCGRWATRCMHACIHVPTSFATWCRPLHPCLPCAWVSPPLLLHSLPMCRSCSALLLPVQHSVGTTWAEPDDEDVPAPAPTLRAMPLRPRAVPSVILAGAAWVGWCSSATKCSAQSCVIVCRRGFSLCICRDPAPAPTIPVCRWPGQRHGGFRAGAGGGHIRAARHASHAPAGAPPAPCVALMKASLRTAACAAP